MILLTADLHLFHENIISYCARPFGSLEEMHAALDARWREVVGESDLVYVLGDVALGHVGEALEFVAHLPGRKILVPGNHDRCWNGRRRSPDALYLAEAFSAVQHTPAPLRFGGRRLRLDHFPYRGDSRPGAERYAAWRPEDQGAWLAHGHVHNRWRQRGRQINVGVDAWAGRPVPLDTVATLMDAGPRDLDPLEW